MADRDRRLRWLGYGLLAVLAVGELGSSAWFFLPVCESDCGDGGGRGLFLVAVAGWSLLPVGALLIVLSREHGSPKDGRSVRWTAFLLSPLLLLAAAGFALVGGVGALWAVGVALEGLADGEVDGLLFLLVLVLPAAAGCCLLAAGSAVVARALADRAALSGRVRRWLRRGLLVGAVPASVAAASALIYAVQTLRDALRVWDGGVPDPAFTLPQVFLEALGIAVVALGAACFALGSLTAARRLRETSGDARRLLTHRW